MAGVERILVRSGASLLPCVLVLVSACGTTRDAATTGKIVDPRSNQDAGTGSDGGSGGLTNGSGGASGAAGTAGSGGNAAGNAGERGTGGNVRDGAVVDAGSTDGAVDARVDAAPPPTEIPSSQTVTFHITNRTGVDHYVVTAGNNCMPLGISVISGSSVRALPLNLGFQCPCECPRPGDTLPVSLHHIAPGQTYTTTWDARALVTWRETTTCSAGPPAPQHPSILRGVPQPVAPGTYTVSFGIEWALPPSCSGTDPEYRCDVNYAAGPILDIAPMCTTDNAVTGNFSLPATGNVDVSLDILQLDPL